MDKQILTLDKGTRCTAWNYSGQRLIAGLADGSLVTYDSADPASSVFTCTSRFKMCVVFGERARGIVKVVWIPPEYGDAVACISADGNLSLWEEVSEDDALFPNCVLACCGYFVAAFCVEVLKSKITYICSVHPLESKGCHWKMCKCFDNGTRQVLDVQFGDGQTCLKLVAAYSDGHIEIYELLDMLELEKWQLQAEFQNVIDLVSKFGNVSCLSASISWSPQRSEAKQSSFVLGFGSNTPPLNSPKVWEFDLDHQRWLPVAELSLPEDKGDQVYAVAWAPNIGRDYELIAVATQKGISIWHLGSEPDQDGRLSVQRVALLSGHDSEVWEMEWDMSGMTLATTGSDGVVRLWQSNVNGEWHQQAVLTTTTH
ncbi:transducin/WD40 repeat-like superfamily protein [Striga asiatica]|uniref:Transducin/WD40 repeat-like superfamily protein n=1 Tax=Striga asiatica TaxID=4170 RepID=A0A5A7Q8F9_STRAF|nr:transducin/WD40 repeat-like superfamily protein [Striga asiatica]